MQPPCSMSSLAERCTAAARQWDRDAPEQLAALPSAQRAEHGQLGGAEHALQARLKVGRIEGRQEPERAHRKGRQRRQRRILPEPRNNNNTNYVISNN